MREDYLRPPHGSTTAAVITNKKQKFRYFTSKQIFIRMAENWPYVGLGYKSHTSDPKKNLAKGAGRKYCNLANLSKVTEKQRTGTGATKPNSCPQTKLGNKQKHKQTKDNENKRPTERAVTPKRRPPNNQNRTKSIMNKHKVNHHQNMQQRTTSEPPPWNGQ